MSIETYMAISFAVNLWLFIGMKALLQVSRRLRAWASSSSLTTYPLVLALISGWLLGATTLARTLLAVAATGSLCMPVRGTGNLSCDSALAVFKLIALGVAVALPIPIAINVHRAMSGRSSTGR